MKLRNVSLCAAGLLFMAAPSFAAGPVEFGWSELARAAAERGLTQTPAPQTGLVAGKPECFRVRLYYRAVNQQAKFKSLEADAAQNSFSIPGEDVSPRWDLNRAGGGWFQPDPRVSTPYYVVKVRPAEQEPH